MIMMITMMVMMMVINRHTDDEFPQHPCLELVSNSEEKLTLLISRRLITMKKTCEYDPTYIVYSDDCNY